MVQSKQIAGELNLPVPVASPLQSSPRLPRLMTEPSYVLRKLAQNPALWQQSPCCGYRDHFPLLMIGGWPFHCHSPI